MQKIINYPLFSVLIANYNNGKFIKSAIESVKKQSYNNWEIIIVDDCSTDNSCSLYKEYELDSRIHIAMNESNKGISYTKRRCIDLANGSLMAFLDPDDELLEDALMKHYKVHDSYENVSIVFSRHYLCDETMNIIAESRILNIDNTESYLTKKDFHAEHLVSFKSHYYRKTAGLNTLYRLAVDTDLNFMMEEVGDLFCMNDICYKYRKNLKTMATSNYSKHMFWNMLVQYDACKRRQVDVESQIYEWFQSTVSFMISQQIYETESRIRKSLAYRIGKTILVPIKYIKSLFSNTNNQDK